jgi:hypothetical protein
MNNDLGKNHKGGKSAQVAYKQRSLSNRQCEYSQHVVCAKLISAIHDSDIKCVRCIGRNQLQLIGIYWNCLNLIHLIQHEFVGDAPWTRGTIHMRHMIRHECVGDTPWSRGNVYIRTDIYGTSVLVTDGIHEDPYI